MKRTLALVFVLASGCTQWTVIKQAQPAPFPAAQCKVTLAPVDFENMNVGNVREADWLAKKGAEEQTSFAADKQTVAQLFQQEVTSRAAPFVTAGTTGAFVAKPRLTGWEPGFYTAFVNHDTEASMVVVITDDKGSVIDEIAFTTRVVANIYNPSTGGRFHTASKQLGKIFAAYLNERLGCPK